MGPNREGHGSLTGKGIVGERMIKPQDRAVG